LVERARVAWSSIAISEYRAAAAFGDVLSAMLAARAPLDVVGMAGDFVADELMHVELASRLAMELGGGAPIEVDFEAMGARSDAPTAFQRAIAVETSSVVEHPLVSGIVDRIARDEARHTRLGWLYMEWAVLDMDEAERSRMASFALREIARISPVWNDRALPKAITAEQVRELGWLDPEAFRARAE